MSFKKLAAPTLKELFIQELETMILSGELPIGSKLPTERELAKTTGISRSVVNAGIAEMADKGFLEIIPRKGAYVTNYPVNGKLDTLISIMKYNGGQFPPSVIRSTLEMRRVLVNFALELTVPRLTNEQIEELKNQFYKLTLDKKPKEAAEIMFQFEHMLSGFSGNTILPLIFSSFRAPNMNLWEKYFRIYGVKGMFNRTVELLSCIKNRDLEGSLRVFEESISSVINDKRMIYNE